MEEITKKEHCFGCGACMQICPEKCIKMIPDITGFKYPYIDRNRCIQCGLCMKSCPVKNERINTNKEEVLCFTGIYQSEKVVMESSSGGAFTAIVEAFDNKNCVIFGAAYNEKLIVEHSFVDSIQDINIFRKSKYVQSDTMNTFKQVKAFLCDGKRVIYTGTPCQIAGLKSFLKIDYENLLCIDIICTGVASPLILKKSIEYIENIEKRKVISIDMRSKKKKDTHWVLINTEVEFYDGTTISNKDTNMYKACYGQSLGFRESCYTCRYAKLPRISDITIGDWWGKVSKINNMEENKGVSLIIFNNKKWINLLDIMNKVMFITKVNIEEAVKQNPTLSRPTYRKKRNNVFWTDFQKKTIEYILKKYSVPPFYFRAIYMLAKIFPKTIRRVVKKLIIKFIY